jgi:hypothetical protein
MLLIPRCMAVKEVELLKHESSRCFDGVAVKFRHDNSSKQFRGYFHMNNIITLNASIIKCTKRRLVIYFEKERLLMSYKQNKTVFKIKSKGISVRSMDKIINMLTFSLFKEILRTIDVAEELEDNKNNILK